MIQQRLFVVQFKIKGGHIVTSKFLCESREDAIKEIQIAHPDSEIIQAFPSPPHNTRKLHKYRW